MKMTHFTTVVDHIRLLPGAYREFYFSNNWKPNLFSIKNYNDFPIYIGLDYAPNETRFDKIIFPKTDDVIVHPKGRDRIFLYNPAQQEAELTIFSDVMDRFDYSLLKDTRNVLVQGAAPGVKVPVENSETSDILEYLYSDMNERLSDINGQLQQMKEALETMKVVPSSLKVFSSPAANQTFSYPLEIVYLTNDGEAVQSFMLADKNNIRRNVSLRPGEILNHIDVGSEKSVMIPAGSMRGILKVKEE